MDAENNKDFQDWHAIAELRCLGLNRTQIAQQLQLPRSRVVRLLQLNLDDLLQLGNRHRPPHPCRLDPYEESVKNLLTLYPYYSASQIHECLKEKDPFFPRVCEKTVFNYVKKIRKKYDIPARP